MGAEALEPILEPTLVGGEPDALGKPRHAREMRRLGLRDDPIFL
jgi:hypothetical protein